MSILTDQLITIESGYDEKYGVSKTLNNYTLDEIWENCYVGANFPVIRDVIVNPGTVATYWAPGTTVKPVTATSWFTSYSQHRGVYYTSGDDSTDLFAADGIYCKTVWLYSAGTFPQSVQSSDLAGLRMVTQMDLTRVKLKMTRTTGRSTAEGGAAWGDDAKSYAVAKTNYYLIDNTDPDNPVWHYNNNMTLLRPYQMFKFNDKFFLVNLMTDTQYTAYFKGWEYDDTGDGAWGFTSVDGTLKGAFMQTLYGSGTGTIKWNVSPAATGRPQSLYTGYRAYYESRNSMNSNFVMYAQNQDEYQLNVMGYGAYFETDKLYKPIIVDGYVTGYTDDLNAASEIDTYTGSTMHSVPDSKPGGGGGGSDEDNTDPVSTTGAPFGTGLAHYYVTTVDSAVLGQISEALGSWDIDSTKKDLYRNLISCKILKPPAGIPSTPSAFEIYGVKPQYNGADISIPAVDGNPDITFGPYTISRKFGDFRDYAPYTRAEIFLPYCGWCALPSHVVGRSVSVSYFTDVIAGTVKAVVFCEANPVAEAAGVMAYDIPFAAQNVGAKIQAANTGMLAYGKAALQLSAGIGQAVATKGKQGLSSIVNGAFGVAAGYNQLSMAANENYTEISGKAGDGCALAGIDTIIIKIVRPKYGAYTTPPYVPDGFAHTVGFLSMKQSKVSAASGLILCDNVDTSGIGKATDAERAEIKRVLETGLYVNNPPE